MAMRFYLGFAKCCGRWVGRRGNGDDRMHTNQRGEMTLNIMTRTWDTNKKARTQQ